MYRLKVVDNLTPNTYKWFNSADEACRVADAIINNKDAMYVEVENLKTKQIIKARCL